MTRRRGFNLTRVAAVVRPAILISLPGASTSTQFPLFFQKEVSDMGLTRSDAFPSKYLSKDDLDGDTTVTIANLYQEDVQSERGMESKPVLALDGQKPWIVNQTNWDLIEQLHGADTDGWNGKEIVLFIDPSVRFGPKAVGGIRVRDKVAMDGKDLPF